MSHYLPQDHSATPVVTALKQKVESPTGRQLLIVDSSVEDRDVLLAGLPETVEVVVTEASDLVCLAEKISTEAPVDNLHILTHGEPGSFMLGGNRIDADSLQNDEPIAIALKGLLSAGSELALWACSVAATSVGQAFTGALEVLTGANVFASNQPVGAVHKGGTWDIGAEAPFTKHAMAQYTHTLPASNEDFDGITAQIVSNTDHFNNDSTTDWNFIQGTDAQIAIAGNANGGTFTNGLSSDGAGDRVLFLNYNGLTSDNTTFSFEQSDGDHFQLQSFDIGNNLAGYSIDLTITLYWNSIEVGSATINLNTSSSSNGITYTYGGDSSGGSDRPYGELSFNTDIYSNIDEVELVYDAAATPLIEDIIVGAPGVINFEATIDTIPTDITVDENTQSDIDLSTLDITDSSDEITVTLTVDAGTFNSVADGSADGVTETLVDGQTITLVGSADEIEAYLSNASNIQYTGPLDVSGNNVATLSIDIEDGIYDVSDTINIDITAANPNSAPGSLTLSNRSVDENDAGAVVGTLSATDADGDTLTYSVAASPLFEVSGNTLKLKDGVSLDYEDDASHQVTVTVTDSRGASSSRAFTISVNDIGEYTTSDGPDTITGGSLDDEVSSGGGDDYITTSDGRDTIDAGDGNDQAFGGNDDDLIWGRDGNDTIEGGSGQDTLRGGTGDDSVMGGGDNDLVFAGLGDTGDDIVDGGSGDDTLGGGAGNDDIDGSDGNDLIWGRSGNDTIDGGSGDDVLFNGAGNDLVSGGDGSDTLWAGAGSDTLTGGDGADIFIYAYASGDDTITDFTVGEDTLSLVGTSVDFQSAADVEAAATENGGGVIIDLGDGDSLTLDGLTIADLTNITYVF